MLELCSGICRSIAVRTSRTSNSSEWLYPSRRAGDILSIGELSCSNFGGSFKGHRRATDAMISSARESIDFFSAATEASNSAMRGWCCEVCHDDGWWFSWRRAGSIEWEDRFEMVHSLRFSYIANAWWSNFININFLDSERTTHDSFSRGSDIR